MYIGREDLGIEQMNAEGVCDLSITAWRILQAIVYRNYLSYASSSLSLQS